jgi:hypothetical protein
MFSSTLSIKAPLEDPSTAKIYHKLLGAAESVVTIWLTSARSASPPLWLSKHVSLTPRFD